MKKDLFAEKQRILTLQGDTFACVGLGVIISITLIVLSRYPNIPIGTLLVIGVSGIMALLFGIGILIALAELRIFLLCKFH